MILKDGTLDNTKFGQELVLDLYECDVKKINDGEHIKQFAIKLCEVIGMKRFGEPQVPYFGEGSPATEGYSLVQLIETSLISGHFSPYKKAVYLNIFSCKWFDAESAADFAAKWFGAKEIRKNILVQRD